MIDGGEAWEVVEGPSVPNSTKKVKDTTRCRFVTENGSLSPFELSDRGTPLSITCLLSKTKDTSRLTGCVLCFEVPSEVIVVPDWFTLLLRLYYYNRPIYIKIPFQSYLYSKKNFRKQKG